MSALIRALFDLNRFGRFATVGAVGAILDVTISGSLVLWAGIRPEIAKFVGAECAIVLMFVLNDRVTFTEAETRSWWHGVRRLLKSNIVRSSGIVIQLLVVFLLTRTGVTVYVAGVDIWPVVTMPIAIACGFFFNYVGETLVTWRVGQ